MTQIVSLKAALFPFLWRLILVSCPWLANTDSCKTNSSPFLLPLLPSGNWVLREGRGSHSSSLVPSVTRYIQRQVLRSNLSKDVNNGYLGRKYKILNDILLLNTSKILSNWHGKFIMWYEGQSISISYSLCLKCDYNLKWTVHFVMNINPKNKWLLYS